MVASESSVNWLGNCVGDLGAELTVWARLLVFGIVGEKRSIISCLMWVSAMLVWCQWRSDGELYICNSWGGNGQIRQRCDSWEGRHDRAHARRKRLSASEWASGMRLSAGSSHLNSPSAQVGAQHQGERFCSVIGEVGRIHGYPLWNLLTLVVDDAPKC